MMRLIAIAATTAALAMSATTSAASASVVGQWRLNEGAGATATDSSGYGDNGAVLGSAAWVSGPGGGALRFDGAQARVRVPDAPQLDPTSVVSVSAWIQRVGSPGAFKYVLAKGGAACIAASYGLYSGPLGGLQFYISRGRGTVYARSSDAGQSVWDGQWHLVVGTFDGTAIRLYVDGSEIGTGTIYPGPIEYQLPDANDLFIGAYASCGGKNFDGAISNVRVWNTALSPAQVRGLDEPSPTPPLSSGGNPVNSQVPGNSTGQGGGTPSGGALAASPPVLRTLKLSASTLSVDAAARKSQITYADSQSASVTFTVLRLATKARCPKPPPRFHKKASAHCPRYIRVGTFAHRDHRGRNTVRLPRRLRLTPGKYMLTATPKFRGSVGTTLTLAFTVDR